MFTQEELKLILDSLDIVIKTYGLKTNSSVYKLAEKVTSLQRQEQEEKGSTNTKK